MPSYIELDKQSTLPSSSNTGKVIFGINTSGEIVTVDDNGVVTTSYIPPYKVFTALLTQSGGDDIQYINWDDNLNTLTIGVTYTITGNDDNSNFIPNGAPNNNVGTSFIATSSIVAWGTGNTGDNQVSYNTGAPVATVLENTIGNIWFTYDGVGTYFINSNGLFIESKTTLNIETLNTLSNGNIFKVFGDICSYPNIIAILGLNTLGEPVDGGLYNTPIEIRVYN
jgi:hypothetical protein